MKAERHTGTWLTQAMLSVWLWLMHRMYGREGWCPEIRLESYVGTKL